MSTLSICRPQHVPTYHSWMQDEVIRQQTGSEPLTLEAEYDMCASWKEDQDSETFELGYARSQASCSDANQNMAIRMHFHYIVP